MNPAAGSPARLPGAGETAPTTRVEGSFAIHTCDDGHRYRSTAYLVVPKVPGGERYAVRASGFDDSAYYGSTLALRFSAREAAAWSDGQDTLPQVQDRGDAWWLWLSSISGPISQLHETGPYFQARFGGMRVEAEVERLAPGPPG